LKKEIVNISRRYSAELRKRLRGPSRASTRRAEVLGKHAVKEGLETLDIANIHGYALLDLMSPNGNEASRVRAAKRAGEFFLEVARPIERTHSAIQEKFTELKDSNESLRERTAELLASNKSLKAEMVQRKKAEESLRLSEKNHGVHHRRSRG